MSQRHLADSAAVSPSIVSRAERGGEDAEGLLAEEGEARRARRLEGLMARFGRR